MPRKSRLIIVSVILALAMALAFVVPSTGGIVKAQAAKTLTIAFAQEPDNLNAYYTNMAFAQWVFFMTQADMWDYDNKLQAVPVLVQEIPTTANGGISADGKTITVKLKPGLKWSDGQPLNADDVVFSLDMLLDKANNFTVSVPIQDPNQGATPADIKKIDDTTVSVTTKSAQYPENIFGVGNFYVLPKHVFGPVYDKDKSLEKADANLNPTVFSGPFTLKTWQHGTSITLVPNPNYTLGTPKINELDIRFFPDPQTADASYEAGDVNFLVNMTPDEVASIKAKAAATTTFFAIYGSYREALWINQRKGDKFPRNGFAALQDVNVRHAIQLAIDRKGLVHDLLGDIDTVTDSAWDNTPFVDPAVKFVDYDPVAAGKLLDAAGWPMGPNGVRVSKGVTGVPDGTTFSLIYGSTTKAIRKQYQAVIQQQLAKVGIQVSLKNYDATQYFGDYGSGGIAKSGVDDLDEYANNTVTTNPANVRTFECNDITSADNPGGQNYIGFCDAQLDKLQSATESAADPKASLAAAYQMQEIEAKELPVIILYTETDKYAYQTAKFASTPNIGAGITNPWYDIVNWTLK